MNMRIYILWMVLILLGTPSAQAKRRVKADTLKYRVTFCDKKATRYSLQHPEEYLSAKALARRERQGLAIDSTDLPVCDDYIQQILRLGVRQVTKGKWENFLTVSCRDTAWLAAARALPIVKEVKRVWQALPPMSAEEVGERMALTNHLIIRPDTLYGSATLQIMMCGGDKLHRAGFRGEGMTIAILDAGFHNADRMEAMKNTRILGGKDFVTPGALVFVCSTDTPFASGRESGSSARRGQSGSSAMDTPYASAETVGNGVKTFVPSEAAESLFSAGAHGLSVLSCMGMNRPDVMVGTAPEASYWLLRTEDESSETLVEQDYWSAAVEFADSVGVDVVNCSLGYYTFDDTSCNYSYRHLDGRHALISRQASHMADKGMVLVCSAGNSGAGSWKKITPPADAHHVLTVGAVKRDGELAPFSSVGTTADFRIKPDVMALGEFTEIIGADGSHTRANGTSYSTPIVCGLVACLWQSLPHLTAKQLIEVVRQCGNRFDFPDNIYGYGIPDVSKAYQEYWK